MQEVLFQTDTPTSTPGRIEFYDLCLYQIDVDGQRLNLVRESHGWWDNDAARMVLDSAAHAHAEEFESYREALDQYFRRRLAHIRSGFVHSFLWHPISGVPSFHKLLDMI
jgi:hypothetical protein